MHSSDAWGAVAELGAAQHGAVTRQQASSLGLSSRSIRRFIDRGLLREPVPGVLAFTAVAGTVKQQLWVATNARGGGFHVAGSAAAWLHGLDGFAVDPPIEIIGPRGRKPPSLHGLIAHVGDVAAADAHVVDAIPCIGLARTICDIANQFGRAAALRTIDDFERRGFSLRWLEQTAQRLHRPGQSGTGVVRRLLAERSGRVPDSWFERLVEACIQIPGLPPWSRQHEVRDGARLVARVDLACVPLRLAVEAHSKRFHFGAARGFADQGRDDDLAAAGWNVRYVGWHAAVRSPREVADMIERVARRRAAELGVTLPWVA